MTNRTFIEIRDDLEDLDIPLADAGNIANYYYVRQFDALSDNEKGKLAAWEKKYRKELNGGKRSDEKF